MSFHNLPIEIFLDILLITDGKTIGICRRVCKQWKNIIDSTEYIWEKACSKEFPHASKIAKEKSQKTCRWWHIYKNLTMWNHENFVNKCELEYLEQLEFSLLDFYHNLNTHFDVQTCNGRFVTFGNNQYAFIILFKKYLGVIRPGDHVDYKSERYFKAKGFSLYRDKVYFYKHNNVFVCDLLSPELDATWVYQCEYDIKKIHHFDGKTFLFTCCGNIVTLSRSETSVKPICCLPEWNDQIRHICAINDKSYIFYSRYLFAVQTEDINHLYSEFKSISAMFLYEENVLVADFHGYIWLYRMRNQMVACKPIMESIACLPEDQFAIHLDVAERKSGTVIIAITFDKIFLLAVDFFPEEREDNDQPLMLKRMEKLNSVIENRNIGLKAVFQESEDE